MTEPAIRSADVARRIEENALQAIEEVVGRRSESMTAPEIADALDAALPRRTLQYRLKALVDDQRLVREGTGRWARYRLPEAVRVSMGAVSLGPLGASVRVTVTAPLSEAGEEVRNYVRRPSTAREPVGYDRNFLESYRPNESCFLSQAERAELSEVGTPAMDEQPAGTYAKRILNRLLIDRVWLWN